MVATVRVIRLGPHTLTVGRAPGWGLAFIPASEDYFLVHVGPWWLMLDRFAADHA